MTLFSSVALGIVQGVTEFLPVSSSGHLAIAEQLFGMDGASDIPAFFDVLLHLGTLAAVFVAYWDDIRDMILELFWSVRDLSRRTAPNPLPPARRLILLILVGTLPLFLVLPVKDAVERLGDNLYFVAGALIFTGCMLYLCDHVVTGRKDERDASFRDVLLVGVGQAVATCPGISRSGTTITVGCLTGFDRAFAVRYSFLMSIPAILGANLLGLKDALESGVDAAEIPLYLLGVLVAAVAGYACIRLLSLIARRGKFGVFAVYCWSVGALTLAGMLLKRGGGV